MKKFISFLIVPIMLVVILSLPISNVRSEAKAIPSDMIGNKYANAIEHVFNSGIMVGYADGTFKPGKILNRAELLKIVILNEESITEGNPNTTEIISDNCISKEINSSNKYVYFKDITKDAWYAPYVCVAKYKGIISGYPDGTFKPDQEVNFVEGMKIFALAQNLVTNSKSDPWYKDYVDAGAKDNLIPLDIKSFADKLTRGQMADIIMRWDMIKLGTKEDQNNYLTTSFGDLGTSVITYDMLKSGNIIDINFQKEVFEIIGAINSHNYQLIDQKYIDKDHGIYSLWNPGVFTIPTHFDKFEDLAAVTDTFIQPVTFKLITNDSNKLTCDLKFESVPSFCGLEQVGCFTDLVKNTSQANGQKDFGKDLTNSFESKFYSTWNSSGSIEDALVQYKKTTEYLDALTYEKTFERVVTINNNNKNFFLIFSYKNNNWYLTTIDFSDCSA